MVKRKYRDNTDTTMETIQKTVASETPIPSVMENNAGLDLNDLFEGELGEDSAVLKELFSSKEIETKTDLTPDQIKIISLIELKRDIIHLPELSFVLKKFETLQVSKNRLSRGEFVGSFQGMDATNKTANLMTKFGNVFKSDK